MFRPLVMQRVELHCISDELPQAAVALAETGLFNPDPVSEQALGSDGLPAGEVFRHLYHESRLRLDKIRQHFGGVSFPLPDEATPVTDEELEEVYGLLGVVWTDCSAWQEEMRQVEEELKAVETLRGTLEIFASLKMDLSRLQAQRRFLSLRIGTLPLANVRRLADALGIVDHVLEVFLIREDHAHIMVAGMHQKAVQGQVRSVLETAGFHSLEIPEEFTDRPERVRQHLDERADLALRERRKLLQRRDDDWRESGTLIQGAAQVLELATPWNDLSPMVRQQGGLARIEGWIPEYALDALKQSLQRRLGSHWQLAHRAPLREERGVTPSVMNQPFWLRPFSKLVRNYGNPSYGEFDPTVFFALSFLLLFGMMFGDVGHGAVIAAVGIGMLLAGSGFGFLLTFAGISSVLFGFVYGSIFGYEELLPALWMSPMHDPVAILVVAAWLGVSFIALATLIHIFNRMVERNWGMALFAGSGLAGLLSYLALVLIISRSARGAALSDSTALLLVLPPTAVFIAYQWRHSTGAVAERFMVTLIEAFETLVGFLSGTLSFLRVAAFGLNHVALAIAVFTLADMMGQVGHWLMVVGGNIFILVLEGAVVAIQVLRLEYYEGFSRFFLGSGRSFQPLELNLSTARSLRRR